MNEPPTIMTTMHASSNSNVKLVRNDLLCYAVTYVHNSTADGLTDSLCEFYKPEDVAIAHKLLQGECADPLTELSKRRRLQAPVDKQTAKPFAQDITSWVSHLVNNNKETSVQFYTLDLRKVPPCPPESLNIFSLAARVAALEKKVEKTSGQEIPQSSEQKEQDITWPKLGLSNPVVF